MDNFIFRGRDIAEFGAVAAFGDSMKTGAKIKRSEYEMPGGGTVEIGEATYQTTTRTVTITPADGLTATPAWQRAILAWLQGGRGTLVVHNDPEVYRIAQFDAEGTYDWRSWPLGEIQLPMTLQPYAYAQRITTASGTTSGGKAAIALGMQTQIPAPIEVTITPKSGTLKTVTITCGGETLALSGLSIAAGKALVYHAGDNHDELAAVYEDDTLTFAHVTRWAQLHARGQTDIAVSVTGCEANVKVQARCRYPA